jgi:hypothetical protein
VQVGPVSTAGRSPLDVWATDEDQGRAPATEEPLMPWEPIVGGGGALAALPEEAEPAPREATRPHDDFLAGLRGEVSTAAGLMALPAADRKEMLVFLEPGELAKAFVAAEDSGLKKAVIDALENIGSAQALDVIHSCLDDPDPEVQIHALDAADRLLSAS